MGRIILVPALLVTAALILGGCRDFKVGQGRQQDHAMLNLSQKKSAAKGTELGSVGDGALSSKTVSADMIVKATDKGPSDPQSITLTGADTLPALASWAGLSVDEFLRKNPSLRFKTLVDGDALTLNLTQGEFRKFHGLRKVAVARWQMQREAGVSEPVRTQDHLIVEGEGVADLLIKYRTTEDLLIGANGAVRLGTLRPGTLVKVPILAEGLIIAPAQ
jgi:hypothetical protein